MAGLGDTITQRLGLPGRRAPVRVRCHNGMPRAGWLLPVFLQATYLLVKLERDA